MVEVGPLSGRPIPPLMERDIVRFEAWIASPNDPDDPEECWLWTGKPRSDGYGQFGIGSGRERKPFLAHRVSWTIYVGPIPDGLTIDHLCRNHPCVSPLHLEPVTSGVNTMRGETIAAANAAKTHCPQGHALEGWNLSPCWLAVGRRVCRTCINDRARRYAARKKAAAQ